MAASASTLPTPPSPNGRAVDLSAPEYYFNREISWVRFNERVLEEAESPHHPLLERLKFASIFSSNLDEFFMIRVAGLKEQVNANIYTRSFDGKTPREQISGISELLGPLVRRQSQVMNDHILPQLEREGVRIRRYEALTVSQRKEVNAYFKEKVFPVLTPLAIDHSHPFPKVRSLDLNLLVQLRAPFEQGEEKLAVVPIPRVVPRFYLFEKGDESEFILTGSIIEANLESLFPNMRVLNVSMFRVTRNADLDISEAEADDLLKLIERELRKRRLGTIVRLEVTHTMSEDNLAFLKERMGLHDEDIFRIETYLGLHSFMQIYGDVDTDILKDPPFTPALHPQFVDSQDPFEAIRKRDILLHHPYDSFNPVVELIEAAAKDPDTLAIKMTLYRTSGRSLIVRALKEAAANGKQVTALIELKARFDEEANIIWAKELEQAGVNVAYGLLGLKTHCKLALVTRREGDTIRQYCHLSTGNYNEKTAQIYTDFGYFTCDPDFGRDVGEVFNLLTGYSRQEQWRKLLIAPITMRPGFLRLIAQCIEHHSEETPSRIRVVMNSLVDPEMIRGLYRASQAGVTVECIVRGICCLRPGLPGVSEHIVVRSIVGRFLEHTRVFSFEFNNEQHLYTGSADWMQRNLNRRIESTFPIQEPELLDYLNSVNDLMMQDNFMARELQPDGTYSLLRDSLAGEPEVVTQDQLLRRSLQRQERIDTTKS